MWLIILLRFPLKGDYNVKENILNEFLKFSVAGGCDWQSDGKKEERHAGEVKVMEKRKRK